MASVARQLVGAVKPAVKRRLLGVRRAALQEEVAYWKGWLTSKGDKWPEDYRARLDPDAPVREQALANALPAKDIIRVLDVGAGPMTSVGQLHKGRRIEVTATDALADEYQRLLREAGVTPPTLTIRCTGEELASRFSPDSFDVAYARNALDHAEDEPLVMRNMLMLAPVVVLRHYRNEADMANHSGLSASARSMCATGSAMDRAVCSLLHSDRFVWSSVQGLPKPARKLTRTPQPARGQL